MKSRRIHSRFLIALSFLFCRQMYWSPMQHDNHDDYSSSSDLYLQQKGRLYFQSIWNSFQAKISNLKPFTITCKRLDLRFPRFTSLKSFQSEYYGENFNSLTDCDRRYYGAGAVGKVKTYFFGNKAEINFRDVSQSLKSGEKVWRWADGRRSTAQPESEVSGGEGWELHNICFSRDFPQDNFQNLAEKIPFSAKKMLKSI